jgi:molybdopterin synthase sulfur carrier subunit
MGKSRASAEAIVRIPAALRALTGGERLVRAKGATVGEVLACIVARWPALRPRLFREGGRLRSSVLVFLNSQDIRSREGEDTGLADGDQVAIVSVGNGG